MKTTRARWLFVLMSLFFCYGYEINVNCGASDLTVCRDRTWQADRRYRAGEWGYIGGENTYVNDFVRGEQCCELHRYQRQSMVEYRFDLPPGWYKLDLIFSENQYHSPNMRIMDIAVEGEVILEGLDVYGCAGRNYSYPVYLYVQVLVGVLNIEFRPSIGASLVSAISVLSMTSDTISPNAPYYTEANPSYYANLYTWQFDFSSSDLAGFHIYRSTDSIWSRITDEPWNLTCYIDRDVLSGREYRYFATAMDVHGNESRPSSVSDLVSPMLMEDSHLPTYELEIEEEPLFELNLDPRADEYVRCNFRHEGILWENVRIRYRGGHTRTSPKKSWKINFDRDERFYGIDKINLNSEFQDISMMRNNLGSIMFSRAGIDAPKLSYSNLWLNGQYMGIFLQLEQVDDVYLEDRDYDDDDWIFKNEGSNYEYFPHFHHLWDIETGEDEDDYLHLGRFLRILNETPDSRFHEVFDSLMDMEAVLRYFAVNSLIDETDFTVHNHYLHRVGETGKWHIIPWDNNLAFHNTANPLGSGSFYYPQGMYTRPNLLYTRLISVDAFRHRYCDLIDSLAISIMDSSMVWFIVDSLSDHMQKDLKADPFKPDKASSWTWENEICLLPGRVCERIAFVKDLTDDFRDGITDSPILINELCLVNATFSDEYGEYDPWVELINTGETPYNIGELLLSGSPFIQRGEALPSTVLEPGEKRIIWLDRQPEQGENHIDLHICEEGGFLGLFDGSRPCFDGDIFPALDLLFYGEFTTWRSWQRHPDGSKNWSFSEPTPGADNTMTVAENIPSINVIQAYPNPFNGTVSISVPNGYDLLRIYNVSGKVVHTETVIRGGIRWQPREGLPSGIYIAKVSGSNKTQMTKLIYIK